jgi:regulator of replication initiation timing
MSQVTEKLHEVVRDRRAQLQEYLDTKAEVENLIRENEKLRTENQRLMGELSEASASVQSLVTFINDSGM